MDEVQASATVQAPVSQEVMSARTARSRGRWKHLWQTVTSLTPSDLAHFLLVIVAFVAVGWLIWNTWLTLLPFEIGLVLAYIMLPAVDRLDKVMPRSMAVVLILLAGLGVIALFFALLIPAVAHEVRETIEGLPTREEASVLLAGLADRAKDLPPPVQTFIRDSLSQQYADLQTNLFARLQALVGALLANVLGLYDAVSFILGFLVLPTWLLAVLGNKSSGERAVRRAVPRWMAADFWAVVRIFDRAFGVVLRAQIWRAVAIAVFTWIGLAILERLGISGPIQNKALLAMWLGLFSLIPEIGLIIGTVPLVVLVALTRSPQLALIFIGLVVVVQQLESRLISDRMASTVVDLHPAILVPAIVAASQFGLFWVFVAAPGLVVVRDLFRYTYGRVGDPPAPAGVLPTGESVVELQEQWERAYARETGQAVTASGSAARSARRVAPVPAGPSRPTGTVQP